MRSLKRADNRVQRSVVIAATPLVLLLAALLPATVSFLVRAIDAIRHQTELDYGEGIVWQQLIGILHGHGYGPIQGIPAIVYHYPPVYYLVTALVEPFARDGLQAGRVVSILATLITAALIGVTTSRLCGSQESRFIRVLCGVLAGLVFMHYEPVGNWGLRMRIDQLAMMFTIGGVLAAIEALRRPKLIYVSAVLFFLAVYTKQTQVLAPAAVYGVLLFVRPALALRGIVTSATLGLAFLAVLMVATEGRFTQHVIAANVNRFYLGALAHNLLYVLRLDIISLVFAAIIGGVIAARLLKRETWSGAKRERSIALAMFVSFAAVMTVSLLLIGKSGAAENYWLSWLSAIPVLIGLGLFHCFQLARDAFEREGKERQALLLAVPIVLASYPVAAAWDANKAPKSDEEAVERQLISVINSCPGWVISDNMVAVLRAGKSVVWEPAIFAELGALGRYDEKPVIEAIRTHRVCAVILLESMKQFRFNPPVMAAIEQSLPHKRTLGKWTVYQ